MCPMCMTTVAVAAASTASGAGVLGLIALKIRALRGRRVGDQRLAMRMRTRVRKAMHGCSSTLSASTSPLEAVAQLSARSE
jgi:hypothetical protein